MTIWEMMLTVSLVIGLIGLGSTYLAWFLQTRRSHSRVGPTYWGSYQTSAPEEAADLKLIDVHK